MSFYSTLTRYLKPFVIGIPIGITIVDEIGYVARVDGSSMQPLFNATASSDYVFLSRFVGNIRRGDVVSFTSPKNPRLKLIKRVIAIPGDTVKTLSFKKEFVHIPQGHCWVEGDHTGHTVDSNSFGPIAIGLISAKATAIVWPPHRWQFVKSEVSYDRLPLNLLPLK